MTSNGVTFITVWQRVAERFLAPFNSFNYWVFVIVGAVVFGGFGTIYQFYAHYFLEASNQTCLDAMQQLATAVSSTAPALTKAQEGCSDGVYVLADSLATYALAVAGTAAVQMLLFDKEEKELRAFAILCGTIVAIVCFPVLTRGASTGWAMVLGLLATITSLLLCWLSNSPLVDLTRPIDQMGGPIGSPGAPPAPLHGVDSDIKVD